MSTGSKAQIRFTKDQRRDLLCWKRDSDMKIAETYFDAIKPRIQTWLELRDLDAILPSHAEIRDACREFAKRLTTTREFMDDERRKLYALSGNTSTSEEERAVREAAPQFRESSSILADAAARAAESIPTSPGQDYGPERWLVAMLASLYRTEFQKEPS